MKFREKIISSGIKIILGKDENSNDELMKKYKGKENKILHTVSSGSPFCAIDELNPSKEDIYASGAICASYSQEWKNKKSDIAMNVFTGKDASKGFLMKKGTWKVKNAEIIKIKKGDIQKYIKENDTRTNTAGKK